MFESGCRPGAPRPSLAIRKVFYPGSVEVMVDPEFSPRSLDPLLSLEGYEQTASDGEDDHDAQE
jgi:hypothetical protein